MQSSPLPRIKRELRDLLEYLKKEGEPIYEETDEGEEGEEPERFWRYIEVGVSICEDPATREWKPTQIVGGPSKCTASDCYVFLESCKTGRIIGTIHTHPPTRKEDIETYEDFIQHYNPSRASGPDIFSNVYEIKGDWFAIMSIYPRHISCYWNLEEVRRRSQYIDRESMRAWIYKISITDRAYKEIKNKLGMKINTGKY